MKTLSNVLTDCPCAKKSDMQAFGPRVGVAIFVVRDGKFVFLKRHGAHGTGTWSTPGGHVDFGEDPIDARKREVLEETGCIVDDVEFAAMTNDHFKEAGKHYITLWFVGRWIKNEPKIMEPDKCTEQRWTTLDDMPKPTFLTYDHITDQQRNILRQVIDNK